MMFDHFKTRVPNSCERTCIQMRLKQYTNGLESTGDCSKLVKRQRIPVEHLKNSNEFELVMANIFNRKKWLDCAQVISKAFPRIFQQNGIKSESSYR